jgi:hypothetical protein
MSQYSTLRRAGLPSIYVYSASTQLPLVGNTPGTIAYIEDITALFIYNGGWRPLDTSDNGPTIDVGPVSITTLSGTPYSTTIQATDPDGLGVIYSLGTTGTIDASTTVSIDEDSGLLQVSSTHPSDNFSIILTCSDGVFATTRTIPVTITNRPPTFTLEPAASFSNSVGVEFSYQYIAQELDSGQTLEFSTEQSLNVDYPNLQHIDTVFIERNEGDGLGYFNATGGDYMTLTTPTSRPGHGVDVFKWNITLNKFESFQQDVLVETPTNNTTYMTGTAINNDWLFVSNYDSSTHERSAKVLKYNSVTEQFEHWAGGDLSPAVYLQPATTWDDIHKTCAAFAETPLGEPALIVGQSTKTQSPTSPPTDGFLWLFVYDSVNDTWVYKNKANSAFYTYRDSLGGISDFMDGIREISVNPYRKTEFATTTWSMHSAWDIELDNNGGSTASNTYSLNFSALAAQGLTNDSNSDTWRPSSMHWQNENTIWVGNADDGRIYKITRGTTADIYNNSTWTVETVGGTYVGGTATLEKYDNVSGSYTPSLGYWHWDATGGNTQTESAYDRLFVNGNIGVHGDYWFTLDSAANTITYTQTQTETWLNPAAFSGTAAFIDLSSGISPGFSGKTIRGLFNRDHNLFIASIYGNDKVSNSRCLVFGVGINETIDSSGTVTGTPKSFGNYSLTTSVTDGIDTTSDVVTIDVPGGVNFSTTPPTNKTVTASGSTTFAADAISGNYVNTEIKFTTDIDYSLQQTISGATASTYKNGELFVTVNNQVRIYPVNELGEVDTNYTTIDSSGLTDSNTQFGTNITVTDDYLLVGRKNEPNTLEHRVQQFENDTVSAVWSYTKDNFQRVTGVGFILRYYKASDWHQSDTNGELIWTTSHTITNNSSPTGAASVNLEKLNKKTNRVNTLEENAATFYGAQSSGIRTHVSYFKTFHPDYQGSAGTGIAWRTYLNAANTNNSTWKTYIERYSYDDAGNLTLTSPASLVTDLTSQNYNSARMYTTTSPDGKWLAVSYGQSSNRVIELCGDDSSGNFNKWRSDIPNGNQTQNYNTLGWVKSDGEYQLVATHSNAFLNGSTVYVEVFNRPTTSSSTVNVIASYDIPVSNPDYEHLIGPIGCDDQGRFIVGKKLFSFSTSPDTITLLNTFSVYPYDVNNIGGIDDRNIRISYYPDMDRWFVHNGGATDAWDSTSAQDAASQERYILSAFTVDGSNNFTSLFENIYDWGEFAETNINTGINNNGDTIAHTSKLGNSIIDSRFPLVTYRLNEYSVGSIYGASSVQIYKKINSTWTHQGEVSFNAAGALMTVGPITHIHTSIQLKDDELLIGLPGALQPASVSSGTPTPPQGVLILAKYNTITSQWDIIDTGGYSRSEFDPEDHYARQFNNTGHSVTQWNNLILEAGPRTHIYDPASVLAEKRNSPLMLYAINNQTVDTVQGFDSNIYNETTGVAENVIANSYIAVGNTETAGEYPSNGGGQLLVYNSNYNNPSLAVSSYSQAPESHFPSPQIFYQPNTFDGYYTHLSGNSREIQITGGDLSIGPANWEVENFTPPGDYTIQFHLNVDNSNYNYLFCAKTYVNFYSSHVGFKLYTGNGNIYLTNNWITTDGAPPAAISGLQWNSIVPADGSWHHYAIVYDSVNEQHTLWKDGSKVSTQDSPSSNPKIFQDGSEVSYLSTLYLWSIGEHRSDNGTQTDLISDSFDIANLILDYGAKYNTANTNIDISVYGTGTVYDVIDDNTWLAVAIGNTTTTGNTAVQKDYAKRFDVEYPSGTLVTQNMSTARQGYTPANIDINNWVKFIAGNETTIVSASDESMFLFVRDVDNTFSLNKILTPGGTITEISISDNQAESIVVTTSQGVKVYSRNITPYLAQPISYSNGTATINAGTQTGTYTLKTYAKDGKAVSIKHTAMTHS